MTKPSVRFLNPLTLAAPPGYTHVVEVSGGRTVFIAGQVALDSQGQLVGEGDFTAQTRQVFENLKAALAAVGLEFDAVVKLNYFLTDFGGLPALRSIRDEYVNTAAPPASTAVQVVRLFREKFLVEIEAVAVAPD